MELIHNRSDRHLQNIKNKPNHKSRTEHKTNMLKFTNNLLDKKYQNINANETKKKIKQNLYIVNEKTLKGKIKTVE